MTDAQRDQDLVAAIQQDDRVALAALYDLYAPQMLGVAERMLHDRGDAEDLLHDVFLEVWRRAQSYDPARGTVRTWLLMRLRTRALDRLRALGAARNHAMVASHPAPAATAPGDDPSHVPDRTRARLALAGLSEPQRRVVELGYFEGLSCREIAEQCAIPVGTVKSRLAAAVAKLRQQFTPVEGVH